MSDWEAYRPVVYAILLTVFIANFISNCANREEAIRLEGELNTATMLLQYCKEGRCER